MTLDEMYAAVRDVERKRTVLLVGLDDYERVAEAAATLPVPPEVLRVRQIIPPGMVIVTTMGALTDPFPTEGELHVREHS